MEEKPNEVLEPKLNEELNKEKIVRGLLIEKPNITKMSSCGLLDKVKSFLPQMAEAEKKLQQAVADEGDEAFDVENVAGADNVIEMDIAMMGDSSSDNSILPGNPDSRDQNLIKVSDKSWTSDSEDDSSPSPSENSYTSDTDISSSSTCSSSSCESPAKQKSSRKRPLIEELPPGRNDNQSKTPRNS